ncbi:ABC transporter substrate-binding protein [Paracoccus sp. (in: a-proteobacteria)]|uniref:ABC transporter substrate-binding protein n=1 Tax=Paracoccus sp. TaxID=267 RepID=UPI0026E0BB7B|nr:ABC transporter substrate-binding protein [Paracoccus sp. (in: a-proteobacteria)]MDO5647110.1 ABC transporter substrate-binding protein [Paracoccus sp. (in: a-proteobacteria)]
MKYASFAVAALLALPAQADDKLSIMLDWFVNPDHAPIVLAQELGYFTDAGLQVEMIAPSDPNDPPRMAAAGRVDLAVSYQPQLHLSRHADLPIRRVGTLVETPLTCLVVLADSGIESPADLRGKKVGFAVAGIQEAVLNAMLANSGLAPDDVEQINIGWSISPALMSGQVDGVIGAYRNFELNQLRLENHEGRCLYPEAEGVPVYDELIYVANPDRMDRDRVARFLDATARATTFILNYPDEAWERFSATASELQTPLNEAAWHDTWPRFSARPAALDHGRYQRFEAFLADQGATPGGLSVADLAVDVNE